MQHYEVTAATIGALTITLDRATFADALKLAKRVTERKNSIPILSHVLLRVDSVDCVRLIATDLDLEMIQELPAAAAQLGAFCLDGVALYDAVRKMKGECVRLQDNGNGRISLSDSGGDGTVRLAAMSAADYPRLKPADMSAVMDMPADELRDAFAACQPGISTEETRYYLNGIFMHSACSQPRARTEEHEALCGELAELREIERGVLVEEAAERSEAGEDGEAPSEPDQATLDRRAAIRERVASRTAEIQARIDVLESVRTAPDCMRFAATDGHRLYRLTRALPEGCADMPDVIMPRKAVAVIIHATGKKPVRPESRLALSPSRFEFSLGRVTLKGKLIDGTFPDYSRVVPHYNEGRFVIDADSLAADVEAVAAVCSEKTRTLTMSLAAGRYVTLYASSPENGVAARVLDGAPYTLREAGPDVPRGPVTGDYSEVPLGCNAGYLLDALKAFTGCTVTMETADSAAPFLIRSDDRPGLIVVQMPMRGDSSMMAPEAIAKLDMNPIQMLDEHGPEIVDAIAKLDALLIDPTAGGTLMVNPKDSGVRLQLRRARTAQRKKLGALIMGFRHFIAGGEPSALAAHWAAKWQHARIIGDKAAERLAGEAVSAIRDRADNGPSSSFLALGSGRPAAPVQPHIPAPVEPAKPAAPKPAETPCPPVQAADVEPETDQDQPQPVAEPVQAVDEGERAPVKIEDTYGRVYYVLADDLDDSSKPFVRRLHKNGAPFTDRESKGGAWQRILRENIARVILPRGSVDAPAKVRTVQDPAPAREARGSIAPDVAERLAALERIVQELQAANAPAATESEIQPETATVDDGTAALRARIAMLEAENVRLSGLLAAADSHVAAWTEREAKTFANVQALHARRKRDVEIIVALRRQRTEARAGEKAARADQAAAVMRAARLQVRCDALETHAAASTALDRRPDAGEALNGSSGALPVEAAIVAG